MNISAAVSALTSPLPAPLLLLTLHWELLSPPRVHVPMLWVKKDSMELTCLLIEVRVNPHPGPSQTDSDFSLFISQ